MFDMVLLKFFAQGATINTKAGSGFRLIIVAVAEHGFQHRLFDFGNYSFEQVAG